MQEDAGLALIVLLFAAFTKEESKERRNPYAQMPALNLVGARRLKNILEHTAGKVTHIHLDGQRLRLVSVERRNKNAIFLLVIEHIVA